MPSSSHRSKYKSGVSAADIRKYYRARVMNVPISDTEATIEVRCHRCERRKQIYLETGKWECSCGQGGILENEMALRNCTRWQALRSVRQIIPNFPHYYYERGSEGWFPIYDIAVKQYKLSPLAGWLYVTIAAHTAREPNVPFRGKCKMSQTELAAVACMSVRSLRKATKELEKKELLLVTPGQTTHVYELICPLP